jgi:hypothetical protein
MTSDMASHYKTVEWSGQDRLLVTLDDAYLRDLCSRADRTAKLEAALARATGKNIRIDFQVTEPDNISSPPPPPRLTRVQLIRKLEQDPFVRTAMEVFGAEVIDFRNVRGGPRT